MTNQTAHMMSDLCYIYHHVWIHACLHVFYIHLFLYHFRESLPAPMFSRNSVSIWSILKKCIGLVRNCISFFTPPHLFIVLKEQDLYKNVK